MSLRPAVEGNPPPIWIAALGPKMLELTAEFGDGWIPTILNPRSYGERLQTIIRTRKKLGKSGDFTAALWNWCILDDDSNSCEQMMNNPLAKAFALLLPGVEWKRLGHTHPFGEDFHSLTDFIPMRHDRESTLEAINQVPEEVLREFYMIGDADTIIEMLEAYVREGLEHIILWNSTGMFNLEKTRPSYKIMKEVLAYVKG